MKNHLAWLIWFGVVSVVSAKQPNIVIFLADDAGWGNFSHSGNKQLATPNIDSIAEAGVSLENNINLPPAP